MGTMPEVTRGGGGGLKKKVPMYIYIFFVLEF